MAILPSILVSLSMTTAVEPSVCEGSVYRPTGSAADSRAAVAVFWNSERPDSLGSRPLSEESGRPSRPAK